MSEVLENYKVLFSFIVALMVFGGMMKFVGHLAGDRGSASAISTLSLRKTVGDIKSELRRFRNTPGPQLNLILSEVKIELLIREESSETGTLELIVPVFHDTAGEAGQGRSTAAGSRVTVVFVPPNETETLSVDDQTTIRFSNLLHAVRSALHDAMDAEPRLDAKSIEVEISFVLLSSSSVGAVVEAKVVAVDVGSSWTRTNSNTITLSYVSPDHLENGQSGQNGSPP